MAGLNLTVEHPTRLCVVHDEVGPIPASPLVGGEPAGVLSQIFGIVEFKNGVRRVDPGDIVFRDEVTDGLHYIGEHEEIKKRIIQGPVVKGENT